MRDDVLAFQAEINKKLKYDAVVTAADIIIPRRYTTGSLSLDAALGGGLPGNQWVEVLGRESSGKTMLIFKTIAANQKLDPEFATFWLASESFDTDQAAALGVDLDRVHVVPTRDMELGLQLLLDATASKAYDLIACDSYPALIPAEEDEKAMNEYTTAAGARAFNRFWRKMGKASSRDTHGGDRPFVGMFVNQWRDKIGGFSPMGTPQTSPGGHGKDYSFYVRLDVSRAEWITMQGLAVHETEGVKTVALKIGQVVKVKTIKNKSAAPQQLGVMRFYFRDGAGFHRGDYDLGTEYVMMGILYGIIAKKGGWYTYQGQQWNGKEQLTAAIREDLDLQGALATEVLAAVADPQRNQTINAADIAAATTAGTKRISRRKS